MPRPETHMHKQKFYKFYTVHYAFNEYTSRYWSLKLDAKI